jgi:hypothetical protein
MACERGHVADPKIGSYPEDAKRRTDLKVGHYMENVQGLAGGFVPGLAISFSASARAWAAGISVPDLST